MGRPLKIHDAQAVVTITATTATTNLVTTSANFTTLGIIAGMPFVVATSTGGLTTATTYWILSVINSGNNSTFTASATHPSANPTFTPVTLTTTTSTSIAATVGTNAFTDSYFNNPINSVSFPGNNPNTYGVVGGNTVFFGNAVLCNVAIGQNGNGVIYTSSSSNVVGGVGTGFATAAGAANTVLQYTAANGANLVLGYVSSNVQPNVAIANANAGGTAANILGTSGNAQTLYASQPVFLSANIGGLTAGTTYFVKTIVNAAAFTVSLTPGGTNVGLTTQTATSYATQDIVILGNNAYNGNANTAITTLLGSSYVYATPEAGYIRRQKGKQKYLVRGNTSNLTAACYTANVANTAMLPNTMTITATYANAATAKVQSISDYSAELFSATSGSVNTVSSNAIVSGNIVLANATPVFTTFNTAVAANTANGLIFPLVQIAGL